MIKKKKKFLPLISACIVLVVLIAVLIVITTINKEEEENYEEGSFVISHMKKEEINHISYTNADESISMEWDKTGNWIYPEDEDFLVNQTIVNAMANVISELSSTRKIPDATELEAYGLTEPDITVHASDVSGGQLTFYVGGQNTMTGEYYLKVEGDTSVYMVDATCNSAFHYALYDLGELDTLPEIEDAAVSEFAFERDGGRMQVVYQKDGFASDFTGIAKWYINDPFQDPVACIENKVIDGLNTLTNLSYVKMVDYNAGKKELKQYGLYDPYGVITIKYYESDEEKTEVVDGEYGADYRTGTLHTFQVFVGNETEDGQYLYVRTSDSTVLSREETGNIGIMQKDDILSALNTTPLEYAYKQFALIDIKTVDSLEFYQEDKKFATYTVERHEGKEDDTDDYNFYIDDVQADSDKFKEAYRAIIGIEAENVLTKNSTFSKADPKYTIIINRNVDNEYKKVRLEFVSYDTMSYQVSINGRTQFLVNKQVIEDSIEQILQLQKETVIKK